ncbi:MAG: hypothetical protein HY907_03590 [Deltaproteobacteria bacterium]|nr:hypothetical protein [Deltaproteobacteria bacterium]
MSASTESSKAEKSRKGSTHRESAAAAGEAAESRGGDRTSAPIRPSNDGKQRTWTEAHGGGLFIGAIFALIALLVVVRSACN